MLKSIRLIVVFTHVLTFSVASSFSQNETASEPAGSHLTKFRHYMDDLQAAQKANNDTALIECYSKISRFYSLSGISEKAKYYKRKQIALVQAKFPSDSAKLYTALNDYQGILFSGNEDIDAREIYRILNFAIRSKNDVLKEEVHSLYRSYLMENIHFQELKDFYQTDYPEELEFVKKTDYVSYLRIMSSIFEIDQQPDSAEKCFERAETLILNHPNKHLIAKFYYRYGQFYERQRDSAKAIAKYLISMDYAREAGFMPFILESSLRLEELYASLGDFKKAYLYSKANITLNNDINKMANRDDLLRLEIKKEDELRQLALEKQELANQAILNKEKNRTTISIIAVFVLLIVVFGFWSRIRYVRNVNLLLKKAKVKAEQSERFKQQFLANMSHEIRTPMNAILGMSNLMLETVIDDRQKNYLEAIKSSCENLLVIINDVLDLSKLEAGKMELEKIPFDLQRQVQLVYDTLRFKAEEKGLHCETNTAEDVPNMIIGDPSRLNQVLINLCGNAIKFTEKGSVSLTIEKVQGTEATIRFIIKDSGIGVEQSQIDQLFTSFHQADASTSRKYGGTGLGLSISKTLVDLQDGSIEVKSELGVGSEFIVTIPYGKVNEDLVVNIPKAASEVKKVLDGMRILVAEDNKFNQIVVNDTLENMIVNVVVDIAENGKLAIELLEKNDYDVILMDVNMPEMDGHEATKYIRKNMTGKKKDIPIIALTASVLKSEVDKCMSSGMNEYIPKPFKQEELLAALNKFRT